MNYGRMEEQLVLHEGLETAPYPDTEGNWTIGVGYNVTARGWDFLEEIIGRQIAWDGASRADLITPDEAKLVLRADIKRIEQIVRKLLPDYKVLDEVRQRVCVDIDRKSTRLNSSHQLISY